MIVNIFVFFRVYKRSELSLQRIANILENSRQKHEWLSCKVEYSKYHLYELIECYECSKDGGISMFAEVETCAIEKIALMDKQFYDQQREINDGQNKIQVTERSKFR